MLYHMYIYILMISLESMQNTPSNFSGSPIRLRLRHWLV